MHRLEIQYSGDTTIFKSYNSLCLTIEAHEVDHITQLTVIGIRCVSSWFALMNCTMWDALHCFQTSILENWITKRRKLNYYKIDCWKLAVTVPCKKTGLFGVFHTKYIHTTRVENHLKVMLNPPIFSQMLVLMWEAYQWVLVPKFSMVFELQAFKFESTKKSQF